MTAHRKRNFSSWANEENLSRTPEVVGVNISRSGRRGRRALGSTGSSSSVRMGPRRQKANARERQRMHGLNGALDNLRRYFFQIIIIIIL